MLSKNKVQWLDLKSHLWPPLVGFPLAKKVQVHYEFMVQYFKPCLSSSSRNYSWFLQYMYNDNANVCNKRPYLSMQFKSFISIFFSFIIIIYIYIYKIVICSNMSFFLVLTFVCS
jgi:hypothetical protein